MVVGWRRGGVGGGGLLGGVESAAAIVSGTSRKTWHGLCMYGLSIEGTVLSSLE